MKTKIKQRIEQIRNDKVPEGYKKTKYGIFPSHWKIDKLGNYLQELRELSNEIEKYPIYSSSRKGLLPQSQYYDKREAVTTNLGYKKVPIGYVTYRHMSDDDIFRFNKNTTEGTILVSSEYPVFNCNTNGNIDYILPFLNDSPRFKYYCRIQKMGGTRTRLYYKNLCQYTTAFPPLKEQQKIAKILSAQDKVIECYEKKIEQLKRMKKYYLQNMFPKRGETVPKIRFKGFPDPWEQQKLADIYQKIGNAFVGTATPYYVKNEHFYLESNNVKDGQINYTTKVFINDEFYENQKDKWLHTGDIVMVQSGHVGHAAVIPKELDNTAAHALIMFRNPKTKIEPYFLNYQYQTNNAKKKIESITTGNTIKHILASDMQEFVVDVTSYEEQSNIVGVFQRLDTLITLHQRKLEEEKKKKKALQQLLLTGIVRTN